MARGLVATFLYGSEARPLTLPRSWTVLVGRVFLGTIFLLSGINKLMQWEATQSQMEAEGLFAVPALLAIAAAVEILASLSVLTGTFARLGALALFVFLIPVTLVFHDFWTYEGSAREMQMINFLKNLSIMGGLLLLIGAGAGRVSVDDKIKRQI